MATITTRSIVVDLLENEGWDGDFQWLRIYQYRGLDDETKYAVFSEGQYDDMHSSPYVRDPVLLMEAGELTDEGQRFLAESPPDDYRP
jgi:hypothetical protein